jgi:hypothetical protein
MTEDARRLAALELLLMEWAARTDLRAIADTINALRERLRQDLGEEDLSLHRLALQLAEEAVERFAANRRAERP